MIAYHILPVVLLGLLGFADRTAVAETFRDCSDCTIMVKVPAGTFVMGSSSLETKREGVSNQFAAYERPQHSVTISNEFALGQYAVTRGEFAAFARETGHDPRGCRLFTGRAWVEDPNRTWRDPGYAQDDRHPVVCVSFEDAQRYVQWLSRKTGRSYRLPTEAEWEYAARAGTTTARFWGDDRQLACGFANVLDFSFAEEMNWSKGDTNEVFQCRDDFAYTAPVGSFRPNAFGFYDMLGNVYQWIEDCFHDSYHAAPSDGSAWVKDCRGVPGSTKVRILRGGSWHKFPWSLRSAVREYSDPSFRLNSVGFRVARALAP